MLNYQGVLIAVQDVAVSRRFYEECLEQKVRFDFGEDVEFECGLSLHQKDHFQGLLGGERFAVTTRAHAGELFFTCDELEALSRRLEAEGVEFIHPVREEPWGQRSLRFYDPDGHVLEVGESMSAAVLRFHRQGASIESIYQKRGDERH